VAWISLCWVRGRRSRSFGPERRTDNGRARTWLERCLGREAGFSAALLARARATSVEMTVLAGRGEETTTDAGWARFYIPTHRKCAMDGAPDHLWLVGENRQRQTLAGRGFTFPPIAKFAMDGAPDHLWLVGENRLTTDAGRARSYIPTHRKVRDGWGTRSFMAGRGEQLG